MAIPSLIPNTIARLRDNKFSTSTTLLSSLHNFSLETGALKKRRADNFLNVQKVLLVMVPQVELSTLSVGNFYKRHDGRVDFYNEGIDWICTKSGVARKTVCRVLSLLVSRGYMTVKHCSGLNTRGEKIRYNSIRTFTKKFFIDCGSRGSTIEEAMNYKRKKICKTFSAMKISDKCKAGIGKIGEALKKFSKKKKKKDKPYKGSSKRAQHEEKSLIERSIEISLRDGITPSQAYKQLIE